MSGAATAVDVSSAPAEGQPTVTAKFSCTAVSYSLTGFPDASGNTVVEIVKVDDVKVSRTTFTFDGPSGSNVVPLSLSPGHYGLDADTFWNTNGVQGSRDIPAHNGVTCAIPPQVTNITPKSGTTEGGTAVTIQGNNFVAPARVTIGGKASQTFVVNEDEITAVTPAHAAGPEEVLVSDAKGESSGGPSYTYVTPPPSVAVITPTAGTTAGGTVVTIKGSGFVAPATVMIGGEAQEPSVVNEHEITAVTTAHLAGREEVIVLDANGASSGGPSYTYAVPPPKVASITPTSGTTEGGTLVTIQGSGFVAPATVTIGGEPQEATVSSEHELSFTTTRHAAGSDEVVVSDALGSSTGGPFYTYVVPPPNVASITPSSGPTAGGTTITITGSGFVAPARVMIGGEAHEVNVIDEGEITATTSALAEGPQEVVVSDRLGESRAGPSYNYVAPLTLFGGVGGTITASSGVLSSMTSAPGAPVLGVSGNLTPVSGKVLVLLPGASAFVALTGIRLVPFGTIVDTTHGKVSVTTAGPHGGTQTIIYYGGIFRLTQAHSGVVVATLVSGKFSVCPTARERSHLARASARHASRKHVVRKLWSDGHGSFSTNGAYAAGAVLGTRWLTEDMCGGTIIKVATDRVTVTNLVNHKHVTVKAGRSYLAKAP